VGIVAAVGDAAVDDDTWVIGLTGTGSAFCAGLDLGGPTGEGPSPSGLSDQDLLLDDLHWAGRFCHDLRVKCDKPIVAGINGVAVGAGLALAVISNSSLTSHRSRHVRRSVWSGSRPPTPTLKATYDTRCTISGGRLPARMGKKRARHSSKSETLPSRAAEMANCRTLNAEYPASWIEREEPGGSLWDKVARSFTVGSSVCG